MVTPSRLVSERSTARSREPVRSAPNRFAPSNRHAEKSLSSSFARFSFAPRKLGALAVAVLEHRLVGVGAVEARALQVAAGEHQPLAHQVAEVGAAQRAVPQLELRDVQLPQLGVVEGAALEDRALSQQRVEFAGVRDGQALVNGHVRAPRA